MWPDKCCWNVIFANWACFGRWFLLILAQQQVETNLSIVSICTPQLLAPLKLQPMVA